MKKVLDWIKNNIPETIAIVLALLSFLLTFTDSIYTKIQAYEAKKEKIEIDFVTSDRDKHDGLPLYENTFLKVDIKNIGETKVTIDEYNVSLSIPGYDSTVLIDEDFYEEPDSNKKYKNLEIEPGGKITAYVNVNADIFKSVEGNKAEVTLGDDLLEKVKNQTITITATTTRGKSFEYSTRLNNIYQSELNVTYSPLY